MGDPLPAPTNTAISIVKIILDSLIEGVGEDAAVAAAIAYAPWLATPIIKQIFTWGVDQVASAIDQDLFKIAIQIVIKIQSTELKQEYNDAIIPIVQGAPSPAEIQAARDAADRIINRNR